MQRIAVGLAFAALGMVGSARLEGQTSIVTRIGYEFPAISRMAMSNSQALTLRRVTTGTGTGVGTATLQQPYIATAATTYAIATNEANRKIVAQLDADMPAGVTLSASLAAPTGSLSAGRVALTAAATDVVTGITSVSETDLPITYTVSAPGAQPVPSAKRTVVFTIIAGM